MSISERDFLIRQNFQTVRTVEEIGINMDSGLQTRKIHNGIFTKKKLKAIYHRLEIQWEDSMSMDFHLTTPHGYAIPDIIVWIPDVTGRHLTLNFIHLLLENKTRLQIHTRCWRFNNSIF